MFEEESKVLGTKIGASMNDFSTKLTAFDLLTENILGSDKTDQITKQVTRAFKGKFKEIVAEVVTKQMTFDALRDETVKSLGLQDETFSLASVAAVNSFKQTLINSLGLKLFEKEEKTKTGAAISMGGKGFVELFGKPAGVPSTEVDSLVAGLIKEETALSKFKDKLVDFVRESQGGILTQTFEERVAMTEELKKSVSEERVLNFVITMLSRLVGKEEEAPAEETETTAGEEEVAEEAAQEES